MFDTNTGRIAPGHQPTPQIGSRTRARQEPRRFKPARETYETVAQAMGTPLSDLCVIAAHPWNLTGARTAGCSAALIERVGVAPLIVRGLTQPQIVARTLTEIAEQLVQLKHA
jgi:2-haloacid dehalogenase